MKKVLVLFVLLTLVMSSVAFGASTRWNAMGGEHRFIIDTTNYTIYPGRVTMFGNALFVIPVPKSDVKEFYDLQYFPDNGFVTGALLNISNMTFALHYNLDSDGTRNLRKTLSGYSFDSAALTEAQNDMSKADIGSTDWVSAKKTFESLSQKSRLFSMDVKTFPDLFWAMKMGKMSVGARLAVAMDSGSDTANQAQEAIKSDSGAVIATDTKVGEEIATSAKSYDLLVGATMYETPIGDLDLGLGVGLQSFSDDDPNSGLKIESTGGMDIAFNARLNKPLGKDGKFTLVPILNANTGSLPLAKYDIVSAPNVADISYMKGDIGIGLREKIREKGLVVVGVSCGYGATTSKPTTTLVTQPEQEGGAVTRETKELLETTDTTLSSTLVAGCEYPITKWLIIRGGANSKIFMVNDEMVVQEKNENFEAGGKTTVNSVVGAKKSNSVDFYYNMGLRTIYNGLIVDFLLARNMLHRGPYILSGAGGIWASHICVTYAF
jgi:hypothetical protein